MGISNSKTTAFLLCKKTLRHIELNSPVFRIGIEKSYVHYCIEDHPAVSRAHANILRKNNRYYIVDCNSSNHTYLNGHPIRSLQEYILRYGDNVCFADAEFIFIDPSCSPMVCEPTKSVELYNLLYSGLQSMQSPIPCLEAPAEEINSTLHKILLDYPQLCHFEGDWYWDNGIVPTYTLTAAHMQQLNRKANMILEQLRIASTATTFEKAKAIYHWLAASVTYDRIAPHGQTAYGALVEGRAVCKGIAKAYQLLLIQLGVPCQLVEGSLDGEMKHVWIRFCVDGIWYHSDVTMTYPCFHFIGEGVTEEFVTVSENQICKTHIIWNADHAPKQIEEVFFQSLQKQHSKKPAIQLQIPTSLSSYLQGEAEFLMAGSVSQVYRFGTAVLKRIPCGEDPVKLYYAMRESALLQRLKNCRQVAKLNAWDVTRESDGYVVYFVLQYNQPLDSYCNQAVLTHSQAITLIEGACAALLECYQAGVAHLDIHPGNLLITDYSTVLLTDFSSAVTVDELAQLNDVRGTPAYMAPEIHHFKEYSQAADVYSLGIVLYCLLNGGQLPFGDEVPAHEAVKMRMTGRKVNLTADVPEELRLCVEKACNYEPSQRYPDLKSFLAALNETRRKMQSRPGFSIPGTTGRIMPIYPAVESKSSPVRMQETASAQTNGFHADSFGETTVLIAPPVQHYSAQPMPSQSWVTPSAFVPKPPSAPMPHTVPMPVGNYNADSVGESTVLAAPSIQPCAPQPMPSQSWVTPSTFVPKPPSAPMPHTAPLPVGNYYADSVGETTVLSAPSIQPNVPQPMVAPVKISQVQFSAISHKTVLKGEYALLQLYMYEQSFRSVVDEALAMEESPMQEKKSGFYQVQESTRVKVILSSRDIQIEDNIVEEIWSGGYLCFDFAIDVPEYCSKKQILLNAAIYFNDIPATRLLMTLRLQDQDEQRLDMQRKDIRSAFVSYASQDRQRVAGVVQGMQKARPDMDIFFDINSLRSGEDWEKILYQELDKRDTLFLCWSRNARSSSWVEREWRYALETKGIESIEPIPIEMPDVCPPPQELERKHFNDSLLYIINKTIT